MKIYLDVCCLNRPFDDQMQLRVHLETEAIMAVIERVKRREWTCVSGEVVFDEIAQTSDKNRRMNLELLASHSTYNRLLTDAVLKRAEALERVGFSAYDALHVACAESAKCDVLLTTDDRLLKLAERERRMIRIRVSNPLTWVQTEGWMP